MNAEAILGSIVMTSLITQVGAALVAHSNNRTAVRTAVEAKAAIGEVGGGTVLAELAEIKAGVQRLDERLDTHIEDHLRRTLLPD